MTLLADGRAVPDLFASNRGEIACVDHAPTFNGRRWIEEGWARVVALPSGEIEYRCNQCQRQVVDVSGPPARDPPT